MLKGFFAIATTCAASALLVLLPTASTGQTDGLERLVDKVQRAVEPITSLVRPRPEPRPEFRVPGDPPDYQPPLHGANPHGQGTVLTYDDSPTETRPLTGDPDGGDQPDQEEVVIGRSRGEQNPDGSYHGHVTFVALFGNEVAGVDTTQGQSASDPLSMAQQTALDDLCNNGIMGVFVCLSVLTFNSATTGTGSENSFAVARGSLDYQDAFRTSFGMSESTGDIKEEDGCQTATGTSSLTNVTAGPPQDTDNRGTGDGTISADLFSSSSESKDCEGTADDKVTNESTAGGLDPSPFDEGEDDLCADGQPDFSYFIVPFTFGYCNADDTNGQPGDPVDQAPEPYGVREAFTYFQQDFPVDLAALLSSAGVRGTNELVILFKATFAGSQSKATGTGGDDNGGGGGGGGGGMTPPPPDNPPGTTPPGTTPLGEEPPGEDEEEGVQEENRPGRQEGAGEETAGGQPGTTTPSVSAQTGLPFTGTDLLLIALLGSLALLVGLELHARMRRPERGS